ncbi:unnamed protein product [Cuscuta campestris]|uniref:Uncharacterized protein n=1 Tax=Cuscuta campestris TaxID=132261 RepID=A0A484MJM0_9ASTE|nr:unnamed protein product [Cuscuta campestris]
MCRGDSATSQVDSKAVVSLERKPSKSDEQNRSSRALQVQETSVWELEEEINMLREQLGCAEADRDKALADLVEIRQLINEYNYLKDVLYNTQKELNDKDRAMELLRSKLDEAEAEREDSKERLREAIANAEASEARSRQAVSDLRIRIKELEEQAENKKDRDPKIESLSEEISSLRKELKRAKEEEEKSRKAMDGLASALKEVAGEAIEAKEDVKLKLAATQSELDQVKRENAKLKERTKRGEEKCLKELEETKKEIEVYKNTVERLRLEAEEGLLAWNGKEMGFVSCIKRAEEERDNASREILRLRDLLKQAISEANAAKAAANIAIDENSKLKDCLAAAGKGGLRT